MKANHMDDTLPDNDNVLVAEIHQYRDVIRSAVFDDMRSSKCIRSLDKMRHTMMRYYKGLGIGGRMKVNLAHVLLFLRAHKKNALFFRSVEMI